MIHQGDLFDVLPTLAADSFDACVTDPPYGIGFMGKKWDSFKPGVEAKRIVPNRAIASGNPNLKGRTRGPASSPSAVEYDRSLRGQREFQAWSERWAREVFRVLKPGAYLLICGAPRSFHRMTCGIENAGFEIRDCLSWLYGQGFPKSLNLPGGLGTALKPSWEPIILARKPLQGTVAQNVERHGTGAIHIDACRLNSDESSSRVRHNNGDTGNIEQWRTGKRAADTGGSNIGRWPANVLLDEEAAALLDSMTGELTSGQPSGVRQIAGFATHKQHGTTLTGFGDSGGASRFFYCAKPSREERDFGCDARVASNIHPTVKPVELMRWLVRLVTPPDGIVLDPFAGSGTTGMACRYEHRRFVGIEREEEYVEIAKSRIAAVAPLFSQDAER